MKAILKTLFIAQVLVVLQLKAAEPVVTSSPVTMVDEDSEYSYQLLANDADRQPITWQVNSNTQLPTWLNLHLSYDISTYAGSGIGGIEDNNNALLAKFNTLAGITGDGSGNLYVSEFFSYRIRQIAANAGAVATIAGDGSNGDVDSTVALQALFGNIRQIATDSKGVIYIADDSNHKIRQFNPLSGEVSTLAGSGVAGFSDNQDPHLAEFSNPFGVAVDSNDHVYISEATKIRKIDGQSGFVTTIAGSSAQGSSDSANGLLATFSDIKALAIDSQNNIYLTDGNLIRKVNGNNHAVTTIAGNTQSADIDGNGLNARFNAPQSLAFDSQDNLYVGDYANHKVRKINLQTMEVTTFAGTGVVGLNDGADILAAGLNYPTGLYIDSDDTLFIADWLNYRIRKITPTAYLQGTPTNDDVGIHSVCLVASDDTHEVDHCFDITVNNTNDAPTISGTPDSTVAEDSPYMFMPQGADVDVNDTLRFTISNKPIWASFDAMTGKLSGTPTNAHVGRNDNIIISVNDSTAQASLAPFSITVTNTNDAPTIGGIPTTQIDENTPYYFKPDASDVDAGDVLTFSITNLPAWASFDNSNGTLSGMPTRSHLGTSEPITISANDSQTSSHLGPFTIEVLLVNDAPIVSGKTLNIDEDNDITFDIEYEYAQNDPVEFAIKNQPANGKLVINDLKATYTPKTDFYGTDSFIIIGNDGFEDSAPAIFTININAIDDESAATNDVIYVDYQQDNTAYPLDVMANDNINAQLQIVGAFSLDGEVTISDGQLMLAIANQTVPPEQGKTITVDYVLLNGDGEYSHAQVTVVLKKVVLKGEVLHQ